MSDTVIVELNDEAVLHAEVLGDFCITRVSKLAKSLLHTALG